MAGIIRQLGRLEMEMEATRNSSGPMDWPTGHLHGSAGEIWAPF